MAAGPSTSHRPRLRLPPSCPPIPHVRRISLPPAPLQLERLSDGSSAESGVSVSCCRPGLASRPDPLPWLHFLGREDKGLLASGGLGSTPSTWTGRRQRRPQTPGQLPSPPPPAGAAPGPGLPVPSGPLSRPRGACGGVPGAQLCPFLGGAGAGHSQGRAHAFSPGSSAKELPPGSGPPRRVLGVLTERSHPSLAAPGTAMSPVQDSWSENIETRGCKQACPTMS